MVAQFDKCDQLSVLHSDIDQNIHEPISSKFHIVVLHCVGHIVAHVCMCCCDGQKKEKNERQSHSLGGG